MLDFKEFYDLARRDEGCFIHYFHRDWYTCETVMLITIWLDDTYLKAQTGKLFLVQLLFTLVQSETRRCFYHHGFSVFILESGDVGFP